MRKFFAVLLVVWMVIASVVLMAGCPKSTAGDPEAYGSGDGSTTTPAGDPGAAPPAGDPGSAPPATDPGAGGGGSDDEGDSWDD